MQQQVKVTKSDIAKYIAIAKINYPKQYGALGEEDTLLLVASWYDILQGLPKTVCDTAVRRAMANNKYGLNIACVKEQVDLLYQSNDQTAEELWARLRSDIYEVSCLSTAIRYDYGEKAEAARMKVRQIFDKLPEELKSYVGGSAEALYAMANKDDDFYDFEKGRFIRAYPSLKARERTKAEMSPELQKLVAGGEFLGIEGREIINEKNRGTLTE